MRHPHYPHMPGRGGGHDPKHGMTIVLAIVATFFGAPELFYHTVEYVGEFAASRYGHDLAPPAMIGWALLVAAFVYYSARITFNMALVSALLALATRLI